MARTPNSPPRRGKAGAIAKPALRIRMYRLGVGDSFLLTLPRQDGTPFRMLIDCGIHTAMTGGADRIRRAAENIRSECEGGRLDVVVGTHEHWDHLSGFHHARETFATCRAGEVWCAWTENPADKDAQRLIEGRKAVVDALWGTIGRLGLDGATVPERWGGVFGFFGDLQGSGKLASSAAAALRGLVEGDESRIHYRAPGERPFDDVSDAWRIFVLGPPRDPAALRRADPREGTGDAYPFGAATLAAAERAAADLTVAASLRDDPPFAQRFQIPLSDTQGDPFFEARYWSDAAAGGADDPEAWEGREERTQDWRRIDASWLDSAEPLALQLDKITNNTSLVLALELGPKTGRENPVILFAADAQIGNWRSWAQVSWDYGGRKVTGEDLLNRTIIYKVGHHASHNATLMEGGLELMRNLRLALVPTDATMAKKVRWGTLPWPSLLRRLAELTGNRLLRSDTGASARALMTPGVTVAEADTHFDITVPLALTLAA
jgi:hypothetical protein